MSSGVPTSGRPAFFVVRLLVALILTSLMTADNEAQAPPPTTVVLAARDTEVVDVMIRNGSYANANQDGAVLLTRSSSIPEWERRSIFGFETSAIPAGSSIVSAVLVLTVKIRTRHGRLDAPGHDLSAGVAVRGNPGDVDQPSGRHPVADARR